MAKTPDWAKIKPEQDKNVINTKKPAWTDVAKVAEKKNVTPKKSNGSTVKKNPTSGGVTKKDSEYKGIDIKKPAYTQVKKPPNYSKNPALQLEQGPINPSRVQYEAPKNNEFIGVKNGTVSLRTAERLLNSLPKTSQDYDSIFKDSILPKMRSSYEATRNFDAKNQQLNQKSDDEFKETATKNIKNEILKQIKLGDRADSVKLMNYSEASEVLYLYKTKGEGAALSYIDQMKDYLKAFRTPEEKDSVAVWLGKNALAGLNQFNKGLMASLDWLLPTDFLGKHDPVSGLNEYYTNLYNTTAESAAKSSQSRGKGWTTAGQLVSGTVSTLPNMVLAYFTAGAGTAALSTGGAAAGGASVKSTVSNVLNSWMKNPQYWNSFLQTVGNDYEQAKEKGANEFVASSYAIITSMLNAGIEIGSGIETLPQNLKNGGKSAVLEWIKSSVDEGKEEVIQGIVTKAVAKMMYDKDKKLFSLEDEEAIINPVNSAKEFAMGTAIGGILGAPGSAITAMSNTNAKRDRLQYSVSNNEQKDIFMALDEDYERFSGQVDSWLNRSIGNEVLEVGRTPEVLKQIGVNDLPVMMAQDVLVKTTGGKHSISLDDIKQIPDALADPLMVFRSDTVDNALVVLTELETKSGKEVVIALHLDRDMKHIKINRVASAYGKDHIENFIDIQIRNGNLKYIDKNKSQEWSQSRGLRLPKLADTNPDNNIILQKEDIVNTYYVRKEENNPQGNFLVNDGEDSRLDNNDSWEIADRAGRIFNRRVVFMDSIPITDKNGNIIGEANGCYKNGVIYLSKKAKGPLEFFLSHEITHHIQNVNKAGYDYFKMLSIRYLAQQRGMSVSELIAEKQEVYKAVGLSNSEAMDEIAADFAGQMLEDGKLEDLLTRLENGELVENTSRGRQIIQNFIDTVKAIIERIKMRFTDGKYYEKALQLEDVVKAYERAASGAVQNGGRVKSTDDGVHETDLESLYYKEKGGSSSEVDRAIGETKIKYSVSGDENGINSENGEAQEFETEDVQELKEIIRVLRSRGEYLKGKKVSPREIYEIAKSIKAEYGSGMSSRAIAVEITKLYRDMSQRLMEDRDLAPGLETAREIAREILNQATVQMSDEVKDMRKHIRSVGITLSEQDKGDFGGRADWNDFRKANFGRIKISNKGIPVDTFYKELSSLYPQYFSETKYTHPADQLRHIAKVLDDTQATSVIDGTEYDLETTELILATDIFQRYNSAEVDEKSAISEIEHIDRAARKDYEEKRKADKEELRAWFKERYKKILEDRKFDRDMLEAEFKEKTAKIRGERRNAEEKKKLLNLLRHFKRLRTTPEKLEGIKAKMNEEELETFKDAEQFVGKTPEEIVRMLDDWGIRLMEEGYERTDGVKVLGRLELSELEAEYERVKEADPDFLPNKILENKFKRLHNVQIDTLDQAQIRELIELLAGVKTQIENENKLLAAEEEKRVDEVTRAVHKELRQGKKFMDEELGKGGFTDKVDFIRKWKLWQFNANTIFKKLSGYLPNSEFDKLAEELREGQRRKTAFERTAQKHFEKFFEEHPEMRRTPKTDKKEEWISIGNGAKISPGMRIALYLHSKNASNMESIRDFGVTIPSESVYKEGHKKDAYNQGKTIKLSPQDVKEIVKGMTTEEREFADKYAYTFFNGVTTDHINEVSEKLLGYDVAVVKDYFPKNSDLNMVETESVGVYDMLGTVEGQGFLKHRTGGKPVLLLDVNDVIDKTITGTAKYYGFGQAMRDVRKVLGKSADGGKTTLGLIAELHGEDMKRWTEDLLRDLENPRVDQQMAKARARGLRNNFASSVLTGRLTTLLKQGGAHFVGLPEVGVLNWLIGADRKVTKKDIELWRDASTAFWERGTDLKKIDPRSWIENTDKFWVQKLNSGVQARLERELGIKRDVKSAEYWETVRNPEFMKELGKRIDDMINKTQSVYTTMERPTVLRNDTAILKHLLPFRTQNFQDFNMLTQNLQEYRALKKYQKDGIVSEEEVAKAGKKYVNTVVGLSLNYIYSSFAMLLGSAVLGQKFAKRYEEKGEDEEEEQKMYEELSPFWQGVNDFFNKDEKGVITPESVGEKILSDIINGVVGDFMFLDEVWNLIDGTVKGRPFYDIEMGELGMVNDTLASLANVLSTVSEVGADDFSLKRLGKNLADLAINLGAVTKGIPGANIRDIIEALAFSTYNNIEKANANFNTAVYLNPYILNYHVQKNFTNINKDDAWYVEQFYQAAKFAVNIKNDENREKAFGDLTKMFEDMSMLLPNETKRTSFQEKLYKEISKLGNRNAAAVNRVLNKDGYVQAATVDRGKIDKEVERLSQTSGVKVDYNPGARAVLTYEVTDENGEVTEKNVTLGPIESVIYTRDVKEMVYSAFDEAMGRDEWNDLSDEERADLLNRYKKEAIAMVKESYIRNKTGENVPQTEFEKFAEEKETRDAASAFIGVPGTRYIEYDGTKYALTDELAKEYDDYKRKFVRDAGEAIFTEGANIEDVIGEKYSNVDMLYSQMTAKQREDTIKKIQKDGKDSSMSQAEISQQISDFMADKIAFEKRLYWTGNINDYPIKWQDKLYDKIVSMSGDAAKGAFEERIKAENRFSYTQDTSDGKWTTNINTPVAEAEKERKNEEAKTEQPVVNFGQTSTPPPKKTVYTSRGVKSSGKKSSPVQTYTYTKSNPFPIETEEDGERKVKIVQKYYRRSDIDLTQIGTTYKRVAKSPTEFGELTYDGWRNIMDTWLRCLTERTFDTADQETLQLTVRGLDARTIMAHEPESVAAAFWEWVDYGEKQGYDTSEYLELENPQE